MHYRNDPPQTSRPLTALGALCLLALPQLSSAVALDDWATGAATVAFDCTGLSALFCPLTPVSQVDGPEGGGVKQASASSTIDVTPLGNARAYAELDPGAGLAVPVLKAEAYSSSQDGGASAGAFAAEAYTNTSGSLQSYTLDFFLDAEVDDPTTVNLEDQGTVVVGTGIVVKAESGLYSFSDDFDTVIGDLLNEAAVQSLLTNPQVLATDFNALTALPNGGGVQNLQTSLSFDLADGESAYVVTLLTAQAMRDESYADAYSTLTSQFQNATGLVSQSNAGPAGAPEPGSLGLMLLGALLMFGARRQASR